MWGRIYLYHWHFIKKYLIVYNFSSKLCRFFEYYLFFTLFTWTKHLKTECQIFPFWFFFFLLFFLPVGMIKTFQQRMLFPCKINITHSSDVKSQIIRNLIRLNHSCKQFKEFVVMCNYSISFYKIVSEDMGVYHE